MKSILVHIYEDSALDARLQVALDLCRAHDAHLTCLQTTPYAAYVAFDPLGGSFAQGPVLDALRERETDLRSEIEGRLAKDDVRWDWAQADGDVVQLLAAWSALSDLAIISQTDPSAEALSRPLGIADTLVINAGCPVLVVPAGVSQIDAAKPVVLAWNASAEAAHALRQSLPILRAASAVHIVSVGEDGGDFPQTAASEYLARHGVSSDLHLLDGKGKRVDEILVDFARSKAAACLVMGAYGRSRLRETLLGGVTKRLLAHSPVPLVLSH
jgi:nucleotide-binding universal stress UspA family protein